MNAKKGFTIIELGIVILLIGVLAFALSPLVRFIRYTAREIRCIRNLQNISLALRVYAIENNEELPKNLNALFVKGYVGKENVFDCPFSAHKGTARDPDYVYIEKRDLKNPDDQPLVYDAENKHPDGYINVLYIDGDIKKMARWPNS